jgi:hypothetical protein
MLKYPPEQNNYKQVNYTYSISLKTLQASQASNGHNGAIVSKIDEINERCKLFKECLDNETIEKRLSKIGALMGQLFNEIRDNLIKEYSEYSKLKGIRFDKVIQSHINRITECRISNTEDTANEGGRDLIAQKALVALQVNVLEEKIKEREERIKHLEGKYIKAVSFIKGLGNVQFRKGLPKSG